ncbi:MAG: hypothetical protein ACK58N_10615 [Synechocystis sp.]|jgi:hypothetical protein
MNRKQQRILEAIQMSPPPANLKWDDVESLFTALGLWYPKETVLGCEFP